MHPLVFEEFERVCRERGAGGSVLELGAMPSADTLLCLPALARATEKIGINLDGQGRYLDFEIQRANSNSLACFPAHRFDTVLCNSLLEHDARFWRTLEEIRRVARPGALIVIGVPGFDEPPAGWLRRRLARLHAGRGLPETRLRTSIGAWLAATPTLRPHHFPGDYYRFSRQAVAEVFLGGLDDVRVSCLLAPPRFIGSAIRP